MQRDCLPFRTQAGTKHEQVPCPQGGGVRANSFRAGRSYSARFHCGLPWFLPCSLDTATCSSSGGRPANGSQPECHVLVGNTLRTAKAISTPAFRHGCRAWWPPVPWYSVEQLEADGLHDNPPNRGAPTCTEFGNGVFCTCMYVVVLGNMALCKASATA